MKSFSDQVVPLGRADGSTYITEAAQYLEARGLTVQDAPILPYYAKHHGLRTAEGQPYPLEGWAYLILGPDCTPREGHALLRVCNWPEFPLYQQDGDEFEDRPKFLHTTREPWLYYAAPRTLVTAANTVTLHEKISSAALCYKKTGAASIAVSGCTGWSHHGAMLPELEVLVGALKPEANLIVCFDGDLLSNGNIMLAASRLKAAVSIARPDISVYFPAVPKNDAGVGWDDWGSDKDGQQWVDALSDDGVEVSEVVPLSLLVEQYGVSVTTGRSDTQRLEHTATNYLRLLRHPQWADYVVDNDDSVYRGLEYYGSLDKLRTEFQCWLEYSVCRGYGSTVRASEIARAVDVWVTNRRCSVVLEMLRSTPDVSFEAARAAALELVTEGLRVVGPMTEDETVETMLRCFRDMALRWSDRTDRAADDIQWILALIGPTGCGKSKFPTMLLSCLDELGYQGSRIGQLEKLGSRANFAEYSRISRDSLIAIADDYNANEHYARDMETELYTLTSSRRVAQRKLYKESTEPMILRACYFLTTTDTNRDFIRNAAGSGERRFIPLEVAGHVDYNGRKVGNREVIERCGGLLLRWAAQRGELDVEGDATEFSIHYVGKYIQRAGIVYDLAERPGLDWRAVRQKFDQWYRGHTNDYRFTVPMLMQMIYDGRVQQWQRRQLRARFLECGAVDVGKGKVNIEDGKEVQKDSVLSVKDPDNFVERLRSI